jgi:hypothetical protein
MRTSGFGYVQHSKPSEFHLGMHVICNDNSYLSMPSVGYVSQFHPVLIIKKLGCLHPWSYVHVTPGNAGGSIPFVDGELCKKTFDTRASNYEKARSVEFLSARRYEKSEKCPEEQTEFEVSRRLSLKQQWGFEHIPAPDNYGPDFGKRKCTNKIPVVVPPLVFAPDLGSLSAEHSEASPKMVQALANISFPKEETKAEWVTTPTPAGTFTRGTYALNREHFYGVKLLNNQPAEEEDDEDIGPWAWSEHRSV